MLGHAFQFRNQLVCVPHNFVGSGKEAINRFLNTIDKLVHLDRHLVQISQTLLKLRIGRYHKRHQAVFKVLGLHEKRLEAVLEFRIGNRPVQRRFNSFEQDLRRIANFARKPERFGNAGIELARNRITRHKIFVRITENHADLAFAHDTDVLHADFGILRDFHIRLEPNRHHDTMARKFNGLHAAKLYAINLDRVIQN